MGDSTVMWTYSHGFKVPVELLGDLVREFSGTRFAQSEGG